MLIYALSLLEQEFSTQKSLCYFDMILLALLILAFLRHQKVLVVRINFCWERMFGLEIVVGIVCTGGPLGIFREDLLQKVVLVW